MRSELNFPVGEKKSLDLVRVSYVFHLVDAILFHISKRLSSHNIPIQIQQSILQKFSTAIQEGEENYLIQKVPHLVLINEDFYFTKLLHLFIEWYETFVIYLFIIDMRSNFLIYMKGQ